MQRILIIDPEENVRETLGVFCEMLGYEPLFAADASSCRVIHAENQNCAEENPCADIILINQGLPTMTGLEFVERQIEKGCKAAVHCKAIMAKTLTPEEFKLTKTLGCHVLQKPVTYEIMEQWLASVEDKNREAVEIN